MSKKLIIYLGFFAVLIAGFYYFLFRGTDNWKVKMPVLSYVQPFTFTNQDGQIVTEKTLQNKITVVEYFFTTCKGICPKLNKNMKEIYLVYKDNPDFQILSHTCNPETDSVPVLSKYS
jgi:protein SCO1/2